MKGINAMLLIFDKSHIIELTDEQVKEIKRTTRDQKLYLSIKIAEAYEQTNNQPKGTN
jgi:hypothetical protein